MGGDGLLNEPEALPTDSEQLWAQFPFYLSIGMSSAEYWTGDPVLARYYREAYNIKQEQEDYNAWLQGMYFYEALSVALANAFRKKGAPAANYSEEPYLQRNKKSEPQPDPDAPDKFEIWMNQLVANGAGKTYNGAE